ncbi:MAG: hypothetical protein EP332_07505 [Bacteroidetes bacterium]|nr:MAG: hypothetical protein EP332_07505 [Bacteroidota bacterium]
MLFLYALLALVVIVFFQVRIHFGAKPNTSLQRRYAQSPNWKEDRFMNLEETTMALGLKDVPGMLKKQFLDRAGRVPKQDIPIRALDWQAFTSDDEDYKIIWLGHSAVLIRFAGKTWLIDPMMGPNASPIAPFKTKRFESNALEYLKQIPKVDYVLMSHDHYDHLDFASIQALLPHQAKYITALGVGRHLEKWGIPACDITELDWWDHVQLEEVSLHFTPSRHFSGRGTRDRAKSLWGGFYLQNSAAKLYFSGDGGYGDHFKEVKARLGKADVILVENGQYNALWHQIHMYPEEAVSASVEMQADRVIPVHWGGFALAMHSWQEPVERFSEAAQQAGLNFEIPYPGEMLSPNTKTADSFWWKSIQ